MTRTKDYQEFLLERLKDPDEALSYATEHLTSDTTEEERASAIATLVTAGYAKVILGAFIVHLWQTK